MKLPMRVAFVFYEGQGSTNHYEVHIPRGFTVGQFLERARVEIQKEFKELRNAPVESLLCVRVARCGSVCCQRFCQVHQRRPHSAS